MNEEWRRLGHSLSDYEISDLGRVRRAVGGKGAVIGELRPYLNNGFYYVNLRRRGRLLARLVCTAFHGPPPSPRCLVAYHDGDRLNCKASNLYWKFRQTYRD